MNTRHHSMSTHRIEFSVTDKSGKSDEGNKKKTRKDLQRVRAFRVQEVPVTDFRAALVICHARTSQKAALGGVGDGH